MTQRIADILYIRVSPSFRTYIHIYKNYNNVYIAPYLIVHLGVEFIAVNHSVESRRRFDTIKTIDFTNEGIDSIYFFKIQINLKNLN